eukprot:TRINITY_DN1959_c0_g1_i9.p1 TRINITY_DN1959_c0_g1~~TRINITY_DN1959_c0_g1_i9.p1  ORF type:complete len:210 (+),score=2.43 TRINITY_DN1959_c0_g1_i9:161-790(+)
MFETDNSRAAVETRKSGWMMSREFYVTESAFKNDLTHVWLKTWLFAGYEFQVSTPGQYFTFQVGNENVVIVRNDNGELNGFHNVCRHRGARICTSPEGSIKSFVCPYHAWTYDKQGTLIKATHTEGLDLSDRNLHRIHLETIDGLIFVCFSDDPPDFRVARETISSQRTLNTSRLIMICITIIFLSKIVSSQYGCLTNRPVRKMRLQNT